MKSLSNDEKQQVLGGLRKRYFVTLAFLAGWMVCWGLLMAMGVFESDYAFLLLLVLFFPFMIGLFIYGAAEKNYGKSVTQRYASLADWLLRTTRRD